MKAIVRVAPGGLYDQGDAIVIVDDEHPLSTRDLKNNRVVYLDDGSEDNKKLLLMDGEKKRLYKLDENDVLRIKV